jgi:hypothetical protein
MKMESRSWAWPRTRRRFTSCWDAAAANFCRTFSANRSISAIRLKGLDFQSGLRRLDDFRMLASAFFFVHDISTSYHQFGAVQCVFSVLFKPAGSWYIPRDICGAQERADQRDDARAGHPSRNTFVWGCGGSCIHVFSTLHVVLARAIEDFLPPGEDRHDQARILILLLAK